MKRIIVGWTAGSLLMVAVIVGQQNPTAVKRVDGRPDLSGLWAYSVDLPSAALKQVIDGKTVIQAPDRSGRLPARVEVQGALPSTSAPSFKPEFGAKAKELYDNQSKTDGTFYCGRPGVPRLGPPRKIVQLPTEMIFLYEDMSGDVYRIIPTDGRKHRSDADPSFNGDAVGRWEGDTLVVESVNFVKDTWFGEFGYLHSDALRVTERFWRQGEQLAYQVTVDDPKVLTQPWVMAARLIKPSNEPLIESAACVEDDGHRLTNLDHHTQR